MITARGVRLAVAAGLFACLGPGFGAVFAIPRASAGEPSPAPFVQVRIDRVTPDMVTTTSPPVITVSGTVINVGDRPVRDVMVRLEGAPAVTSSAGLRTNLDGATDQYQPVGDFITVAADLQRGQQASFALTAPVRSSTIPSLAITNPGIFPVLVNANGTPDYGAPARLDNARFLLPVVGVPPDPDNAPSGEAAGTVGAIIAPDTSQPVQVTMLWPLADRPHLAPGVAGGTVPVRLIDDDLAHSLAPGGRLETLLSAAEVATSHEVDADGAVGRALCLAVDPDLLVTVNAMTGGYVVSDSSGDTVQPTSISTHPGTGQAAAVGWLDRLRTLAHRICVAASPYAQADLSAVHRVGDPRLTAIAVNTDRIVDKILGVSSIHGVTLLADGPLTSRTVDLLNANGNTVVIAAAEFAEHDVDFDAQASAQTAPRRVAAQVVAAPFDPAVGAALAAAGTEPVIPTYLDAALSVPLRHDSDTARRQDALGALLWRGLTLDTMPRTQILMPPSTWQLNTDDAQAILTGLATEIQSGLAVPRPLSAAITDAAALSSVLEPTTVTSPARGRFDDNVIAEITNQVGRLWGLNSALITDVRTGLTGAGYTAPLREDMLRALSQSSQPDTRNGLALQRLSVVGNAINDLFAAVKIVNPGGSYTLATEHSPLPLALHNGLAVPIRVRLQVNAPPGMTVTDVGEIELPPGYLPVRVPIEVNFTQRVAVDVALQTADGLALGEPVRLSVHCNAYGKVLFAITMAAAAVLAALTGRRLWHRFRGQPDRADLDRPDPSSSTSQKTTTRSTPDEPGRQVGPRITDKHPV